MKKLLTLLSGISMIAVSGGSVIACGGNNYDKKDNNGDSILIDGLGGLSFNEKDGTTSITTSDILNEIMSNNGDSSLREKVIQRFMSLFSAGFLINGAKEINSDITKNPYLIDGLESQLTTEYDALEASVKSDIKTERDKYDDDYGKKASDKWLTMLKGLFPGIKDLKTLEQKYQQYKMLTDSDDNVNTRLLKVLLTTNQQGIAWTSVVDLQIAFQQFCYLKTEKDRTNWVNNNFDTAQKIIWGTVPYSNISDTTIKNSTKETIADDFVKAFYSDGTKKITDLNYQTDGQKIVSSAPDNIDSLNSSATYASKGFLSNSQRFFLNKFYETQMPVAISQATLAFGTNGKMDDGISEEEDFENNGTMNSAEQKSYDNKNTFLSSVSENMDSLAQGKTFDDVTQKSISSLLTLSDSTNFSQMLRNSVYDYVNKKTNAVDLTTATNLRAIVNSINRSDKTKMYGDLGNGTLAFIDKDGLQIIKIQGYDILEDSATKTSAATGNIGNDNGRINSDTLKELSAFQKFNDMSDNQKRNALQTPSEWTNDKSLYNQLNSKVSNPYLKWLVNQSLMKGITSSVTSFDILDDLNKYVKISQPDSSGTFTYWTALLDYFFEIQNPGASWADQSEKTATTGNDETTDDETTKGEDFFNKYFTTGDNAEGKKLVDNIFSWIKSIETTEVNDAIEQFISAQTTENKSITDNTTEGYPKGVFDVYTEATMHTTFGAIFIATKKASTTQEIESLAIRYDEKLVNLYMKEGWF